MYSISVRYPIVEFNRFRPLLLLLNQGSNIRWVFELADHKYPTSCILNRRPNMMTLFAINNYEAVMELLCFPHLNGEVRILTQKFFGLQHKVIR